MSLIKEMVEFDDLLDETEAILREQEIDPLDDELSDTAGLDPDEKTAFQVMKDLMSTYKDFCDACENAWKIQEIPGPIRQRLITLDQNNQEKYQKLYQLMQKYVDQMKGAVIKND